MNNLLTMFFTLFCSTLDVGYGPFIEMIISSLVYVYIYHLGFWTVILLVRLVYMTPWASGQKWISPLKSFDWIAFKPNMLHAIVIGFAFWTLLDNFSKENNPFCSSLTVSTDVYTNTLVEGHYVNIEIKKKNFWLAKY